MAKVNAYEVAKLAHVSPSTVSRVINHRQQVNPQTLRQVEDAMESLGFSARPGLTKLIIVIVQHLDNIFYVEVIKGIRAAARKANIQVMIDQTPLLTSNIDHYLSFIERFHPYGIITLDRLETSVLDKLNQLCRTVQCCEYNPESTLPFVSINDYAAAYKATNYLISSGRTNIGLLNTSNEERYAVRRREGFVAALQEHGLAVNNRWMPNFNSVDITEVTPIVEQLINGTSYPDAFLCVSDTMAAAVLKVAAKYHLQVPEDVSVMGFDNTLISRVVEPPLSTVNVPNFQEGFTAVQMMMKSYEEKQQIILPAELIIRQSTN